MIADFDVGVLAINTCIYLIVLAMTCVFIERPDRTFFFYLVTFTYIGSMKETVRVNLLKEAEIQ
jgi:hypothetical protein